jgi:hypothetical protein
MKGERVIYLLEVASGTSKVFKVCKTKSRKTLATQIRGLPRGGTGSQRCIYAAEVRDATHVRRQLAVVFAESKVKGERNKNLFGIDKQRLVAAIGIARPKEIDLERLTGHPRGTGRRVRAARRGRIDLGKLGIKPGDILTFREDPSVTVKVLGPRTVEYQGRESSLSEAGLRAHNRLAQEGRGRRWKTLRGPRYWMFEGETLADRRRRWENVAGEAGSRPENA